MTFPSVESVGPKVSGELIQTAIIAVLASLGAILIYIWLQLRMAVLGGCGGRARA
jgi:preprotein translocase subunit SecF